MPQINQLADVAYSQFFWLLLVLGIIYFAIGRGMVPKIEATVEARNRRVADDLAAAERARGDADATEEAYRVRMDRSRAEAMKVAAEAKAASVRATEARVVEGDQGIAATVSEAERRLGAARASALSEIEGVAADAARDLVAKLSGVSVGRSEATRAARAALASG